MKTIRVEINGTKFRVFDDGMEIKGVKQFLLKVGVEYAPTMEIEQYITDDAEHGWQKYDEFREIKDRCK